MGSQHLDVDMNNMILRFSLPLRLLWLSLAHLHFYTHTYMSKLKTDIHTKFLDVCKLSSLNMIASYKWDGKTAANTIINQYYDEVKKLKAMKVNWWITLSLFIERLFRVMAENQHQKKSSYLLSSVWFLSPAPLPTVKLPLAACQSQFTRVTSQIIIWNRKCFRDPLTRSPLGHIEHLCGPKTWVLRMLYSVQRIWHNVTAHKNGNVTKVSWGKRHLRPPVGICECTAWWDSG